MMMRVSWRRAIVGSVENATTTKKKNNRRAEEQQNNNNKTRDEMSNVANGVVLAQRRENFRRREGVAEEIHHQR